MFATFCMNHTQDFSLGEGCGAVGAKQSKSEFDIPTN